MNGRLSTPNRNIGDEIKKVYLCPKNYHTCRYFNKDIDSQFHCNKDSNIGTCIPEMEKIMNTFNVSTSEALELIKQFT